MERDHKSAGHFRYLASARGWQWLAAAALAFGIMALHVVNLRAAGGLWRDEAAAVELASLPSLGEIWTHLEHESFPLLLTMLLRGWHALGLGHSDFALRAFGFLVGLALLGALGWSAWEVHRGPPLLSLVLFALSPVTIRWGDSLRAYGLGMIFLLLALVLVWKAVSSFSRRNLLLAVLSGLLAVQTLYQNAFLLAAFCLTGAVVAGRRHGFPRAVTILALGLPAALSLFPYLGVIRRANQWNVATQRPLTLERIGTVLHRALDDPGALMWWLWLGALAVILFLALVWCGRRQGEERDLALFVAGVLLTSSGAFYLFLTLAKFPTEVWYYLPWMAVSAVVLDGFLGRVIRSAWSQTSLAIGLLAAGAFLFPGVREQVEARMTNIDLIAQQLNENAAAGDLVLVHPWFCGASFHRYYAGAAPWMTIPPLATSGLQRLDLFKAQMQIEDPIAPVLERAEIVLRGGGTVWLVGYFIFLNPPQPAPSLPRAGAGPEGWRGEPYMQAYGMQTTYFLQTHAARGRPAEIPLAQKVNPFENLPLQVVTGWRAQY